MRIVVSTVYYIFILSVSSLYGQDNTRYDVNAAPGNSGDKVSFFGAHSGRNNTGNATSIFGARQDSTKYNTGDSLTYFGYCFAFSNIGHFNTMIGYQSGEQNTSGHSNTFFGSRTGYQNGIGIYNTYLGKSRGALVKDQSNNTLINNKSFSGTSTGVPSGTDNVSVGWDAVADNESGDQNTSIGSFASHSNISGSRNTSLGYFALASNTLGINNTAVGNLAGRSILGNNNTILGANAGADCEQCEENTVIGVGAGRFGELSMYNITLGFGAGATINGKSNITIGSNTGPACIESNCFKQISIDSSFHLDVSRSDNPLIFGDFSHSHVIVNGTFEVMGGVDIDSDIDLKENIEVIRGEDILDKVIQLPIYQWSYLQDSSVKHIGPMAQDFQRIFQLSDNETSIPIVDLDGIKLVAIKELSERQNRIKKSQRHIQNKQDEIKNELGEIRSLLFEIKKSIYHN